MQSEIMASYKTILYQKNKINHSKTNTNYDTITEYKKYINTTAT